MRCISSGRVDVLASQAEELLVVGSFKPVSAGTVDRLAWVLLPVRGPAQDVAATTSPLAAVRTATITIATRGEVASAAKPAISAPRTKPKSRQKR